MTTSKYVRQVFDNFGCDKGRSHGYEALYSKIIFGIDSILEIGIKQGRSLASWDYLLPGCELYATDITDRWFEKNIIPKKCVISLGDSTKQAAFDRSFDLIIDDGDHHISAQIATFNTYHTLFNKFYVIEDVFVCNYTDNVALLLDHIKSKGYSPENISVVKSLESVEGGSIKRHVDYLAPEDLKERIDVYAIIITK